MARNGQSCKGLKQKNRFFTEEQWLIIPEAPQQKSRKSKGKPPRKGSGTDSAERQLSTGELIGPESEKAVVAVLERSQLYTSGLFRKIEHHPKGDPNRKLGFDVTITLSPELKHFLHISTMHIRVKSDPKRLPDSIQALHDDKVVLRQLLPINDTLKWHPIIGHNVFFLNGGGGSVTDAGVIAPLIYQMYEFICFKHEDDARKGEAFLTLLAQKCPMDLNHFENQQDILDRDFTPVIFKIFELQAKWEQMGRDGADSTVENLESPSTETASASPRGAHKKRPQRKGGHPKTSNYERK